jgi:hypothetical protein
VTRQHYQLTSVEARDAAEVTARNDSRGAAHAWLASVSHLLPLAISIAAVEQVRVGCLGEDVVRQPTSLVRGDDLALCAG